MTVMGMRANADGGRRYFVKSEMAQRIEGGEVGGERNVHVRVSGRTDGWEQ